MIDWLNQNEGAATFFAGVASAAVAIVAIVLSWWTTRSARADQREANERARDADERANELAYLGVRAEMGALLSISGGSSPRRAVTGEDSRS